MDVAGKRQSTHTNGSGDSDGRNGDQKKNLWTSMLESVASGKRLPEKNLLVLGISTLIYGVIALRIAVCLTRNSRKGARPSRNENSSNHFRLPNQSACLTDKSLPRSPTVLL